MHAIRSTTLAVALLTAATVRAADIPGFAVVEAPEATCPSIEQVQSALSRLRGSRNDGAEPSYRLFVERTGDQMHVELRDGGGHSVLVRELQVAATDCEHAAEAIALIVERHFRAIEWSPAVAATAATAPPSPIPPAPPAAAPPTVAATAAGAAPRSEHPPLLHFDPTALPRLAFGVGPAFWSRGDTFAVALYGRWRVLADGPLEIGAGVLLPPLHASAAVGSGGNVRVTAVPLTASLGLAGALGKLAAGVHVSGLWAIEHGASQAIADPATAWRTVFGLGPGISLAWPLSTRLRLTGSLDGYRTVLGRSYAIAGVPGTVLEPALWQAIAVLGAEWVVSP